MKNIAFLFFLTFFVSCFYAPVPRYLKNKQLSYCYDDKDSGIDSLVNIIGYFTEKMIGSNELISKTYYSNGNQDSSSYMNFMFYENGMCVFGFHNYGDSLSNAFKKIMDDKSRHNYFYNANTNIYWGNYQIHGDTIKLKVINHPSFMSPTWMAYEEWYKIIDKNRLQPIAYKKLDVESKNNSNEQIILLNQKKHLPATYTPLKERPEPRYSWILKHKWFWCKNKVKKGG